jgi:hypothetical protein
MAQPPSRSTPRARAKTPAERAEEATAVQRRLKQEAAERRRIAAAAPKAPRSTGQRRTP